MSKEPRILVSLATYNECDNLAVLVREIRAMVPNAEIVIVDDNSPDGTGQLADALAESDPRIHIVHRPGKLGLGTATLSAMRYAIEHGYDYLVNMDADFSHHPRYLPAVIAGMSDHDVMIGSRYVPGGGVSNWSRLRRLMSAGTNWLSRTLLTLPVRDTSGAFRCYRISLLQRAQLNRIRSAGYSFQQEVLHRCHLAGARIGETPIIFENRRAGSSKVSMREIIRSLWGLLRLGVPAYINRRRPKLPKDNHSSSRLAA